MGDQIIQSTLGQIASADSFNIFFNYTEDKRFVIQFYPDSGFEVFFKDSTFDYDTLCDFFKEASNEITKFVEDLLEKPDGVKNLSPQEKIASVSRLVYFYSNIVAQHILTTPNIDLEHLYIKSVQEDLIYCLNDEAIPIELAKDSTNFFIKGALPGVLFVQTAQLDSYDEAREVTIFIGSIGYGTLEKLTNLVQTEVNWHNYATNNLSS